ncbi:MAG: hypothetical protein AAF593_16595 [Planctomycetota bacterium]
MIKQPKTATFIQTPGRPGSLTLRLKPLGLRSPGKTLAKAMGGGIFAGIGALVTLYILGGAAGAGSVGAGLAFGGFFVALGAWFLWRHLPRLFFTATIKIDDGEVQLTEHLWPGNRWTYRWLMQNIDSVKINQELPFHGNRGMNTVLTRPYLRLRVVDSAGQEDLVLEGRRREELAWVIHCLEQAKA